MTFLRSASLWIKTLLAVGSALAIALVAQTAINYGYVSESLVGQEARRVAEQAVRAVERAVRLSRPQSVEAVQAILDDLRADRADQVAGIAIREVDGAIVATGDVRPEPAAPGPGGPRGPRPLRRERRSGRDLFLGEFPCRCGALGLGDPDRPLGVGRLVIEIALFRDGLSAPFARLRRDAIVSTLAALALLVSLLLVALRVGPYVRGKQLEVQLDLARQVQRNLLPPSDVRPVGIDVAAECISAAHVGGDFYDIVPLPDGRIEFMLGDVSGHGLAAALLVALIHGAMSSPPWGVVEDPHTGAERLNQLLLAKSSEDRFASLFWCVFEPRSGMLRYVNSGHLPPFWIRRAPGGTLQVERLADGGRVLGLLPDASSRTVSVHAQAGDLLVLFSDGIVEATSSQGEYFGEERLLDVVRDRAALGATDIRDGVLSAVRTFASAAPPQDDQTILVVRLPAPRHPA